LSNSGAAPLGYVAGTVRFVVTGVGLLVAALNPFAPFAQSAASCSIGGTITSTRTPLPGVVISAFDAEGRSVDVSASSVDGAYALRIPGAGRYTLKAEFVAFAPIVRDVIVDQGNCQQRVDLTMTLATCSATAAPFRLRRRRRRRRRPSMPPTSWRRRRCSTRPASRCRRANTA
jgi:hypothetical protein